MHEEIEGESYSFPVGGLTDIVHRFGLLPCSDHWPIAADAGQEEGLGETTATAMRKGLTLAGVKRKKRSGDGSGSGDGYGDGYGDGDGSGYGSG